MIILKFILLTLFCNHYVSCRNENYVLLKFDNLETYFEQMMTKLNHSHTGILQPQRRHLYLLSLCMRAFAAKGFRIQFDNGKTSNSDIESRYIREMFHQNLSDEQMERWLFLNENSNRFSPYTFYLRTGKKIETSALVCLDFQYKTTWRLMFSYQFLMGFLFDKSAKRYTLEAMMDLYYTVPLVANSRLNPTKAVLPYYSNEISIDHKEKKQSVLEKRFKRSLEKLVHGAKDPLCNLNRNLQFRLCSMGADALVNSNGHLQFRSTYYRIRENEHIFEKPFDNFYHVKQNSSESCPEITIYFKEYELFVTGVQYNALFCDMSIQKVKYQFYLSHDMKEKIGMFVIKKKKKKKKLMLKTLLEVPLLDRLRHKDFDKIYSDEILKKFEESIKS